MTTGNGAAAQTLVGRLQAGIAAATILTSPSGTKDPQPNDKVLLVCDDYLRRLYSYHAGMALAVRSIEDEHNALNRELLQLTTAKIRGGGNLRAMLASMAGLNSPEINEKITQLEALRAKLLPQAEYIRWIGDTFWAETKSRFTMTPDIRGSTLRSDWSIVALPEGEDDDDVGFDLGGLDLGGLMAVLGPFGDRGRRRRSPFE